MLSVSRQRQRWVQRKEWKDDVLDAAHILTERTIWCFDLAGIDHFILTGQSAGYSQFLIWSDAENDLDSSCRIISLTLIQHRRHCRPLQRRMRLLMKSGQESMGESSWNELSWDTIAFLSYLRISYPSALPSPFQAWGVSALHRRTWPNDENGYDIVAFYAIIWLLVESFWISTTSIRAFGTPFVWSVKKRVCKFAHGSVYHVVRWTPCSHGSSRGKRWWILWLWRTMEPTRCWYLDNLI